MILCGHPGGNPNSHHAALAHLERGRLEAFVVPWFPGRGALAFLDKFSPTRALAGRLARRRFEPLADAPLIQGRCGEFGRLAIRALGRGHEGLSYEANDWLMRTMARAARRRSVTAVHSFEDASLGQFQVAKKLGKACLYDMPIGYYPAWEQTQAKLVKEYAEWLPAGGLPSSPWVRPEQKREELGLADLVLAPSTFVRQTIEQFADKKIQIAPYGVDAEFWCPVEGRQRRADSPLRFIYAGQCSIRKGIPLLLEAWRAAALPEAELELVGMWQLTEGKRLNLPKNVRHLPPCSREELRERYRAADLFVFPSFFEGFGLVVLEAMACALPVIASTSSAGPDIVDDRCGRLALTGDPEALVEALRWFAGHRDRICEMGITARVRASASFTWERYRHSVSAAVDKCL